MSDAQKFTSNTEMRRILQGMKRNQHKIFSFIGTWINEKGELPLTQEIQNELGLAYATLFDNLEALELKKLIFREKKKYYSQVGGRPPNSVGFTGLGKAIYTFAVQIKAKGYV